MNDQAPNDHLRRRRPSSPPTCAACGLVGGAGVGRCCGTTYYCSTACQGAHHAVHRAVCAKRLMRSDQLRFEVGQRVQCHMGGGRWEGGRIIQLFYEAAEEDEAPLAAAGLTFPYQIRLDRGSYRDRPRNIFATADADHCIQLPDGIVDDGNAGYDPFEEESLDLENFEFSTPQPDCPVCAVPLPLDGYGQTHSVFMQCCGKSVCNGCNVECSLAARKRGIQKELWDSCAFCRSPPYTTDEERNESLQVLCDRGSATAMGILAFAYNTGTHGVERDARRALDLMHRAVRLGDATSAMNLALKYKEGEDVKRDREKAKRLFMMGARLGGRTDAFNSIAGMKLDEWEDEGAVIPYFVMGAKHGDETCLKNVLQAVHRGFATQDQYREALVACHAARKERWSESREFCRKMETELQMSCRDVLPPREFEDALKAWSRSGKNLAVEMAKLLENGHK